MVKKKGPIWNFFNEKGKGVSCKYCLIEYKQSNSVKMERHIKKCFKCPSDLKNIISTSDNKTETGKKGGSAELGLGLLKPITVDTDTSEGADLCMAGPSSVKRPKDSPISVTTSASSGSSSSLTSPTSALSAAKRIVPFWDQMDIQTNVSNVLCII